MRTLTQVLFYLEKGYDLACRCPKSGIPMKDWFEQKETAMLSETVRGNP
jgi:hypothetical protein